MPSKFTLSSPTVRECLSKTSGIAYPSSGPRVARTVAEALKKEVCREAAIRMDEAVPENAPGVLTITVDPVCPHSKSPVAPAHNAWMSFRLGVDGGGALVASPPHLVYTLFSHLIEHWLDDPVADFSEGRRIEVSLPEITARDDLLIGRRGFLKNRDQQVQFSDIESSMQAMARMGASRVVVNELATPFGQERGPTGEIYYRFYDYLPDIDQFVESPLNEGTYPPECLELNLNSLKRLARLADKYGLVPGMDIANPRSVPESLLQRYPFLRGARVDHPFRCFQPRYTLTLAHPAVRWHYAELLRKLLKEVPELGFITTLVNDSGSGFEYTESLYAGRNGGPYVVKEWMPGDVIAKAAAENIIRYYRLMRDVAHETHPHFRIITGLKNIAEESKIIVGCIDKGIDLRMISQRDDVDTEDWKDQLQEIRQKESDFVTDTNTRGTPYVLGVPSPWLAFEQLGQPTDAGFVKIDVTVDPPYLVSHSVNREVVRGFQIDRSRGADALIHEVAIKQVGEDHAGALLKIWKLSDEVVRAAPCHRLYGGLGFTWYRFWVRPFVPDIGAIPPEDRRYYEKHFLSHFNNPHNIDLAADMLWVITSPEECADSLTRFDTEVWDPLDRAIALSTQMAGQLAEESEARARFEETRQRLIAYRCFNMTMRNLCAWIAGVHGYLKAEDETEKRSRLAMVREMVTSELKSTKALLHLWETGTVDFMPISAYGETMHDYGINFGELLKKKISLMEKYGDRVPQIDPNYMWRMPEGSSLDEAEYMNY